MNFAKIIEYSKNPEIKILKEAIESNDIETVKQYLKYKDYPINVYGQYPIHVSVEYGHYDIIKLLIENNIDINAVDCCKITALITAVYMFDANNNNTYKIITELVQNGADVSLKDEYNDTAYDIAVQRHHTELYDLLTPITLTKKAK